jgi:2-phosphosulfolactate phosphatase
MTANFEVLFSPAEFATLPGRDLRDTTCVVFDVLRATSTMITALAHGAHAVVPVEEISEALALRQQQPDVLLAGERMGVRIDERLTGSIGFDLGNSPREFTVERVKDKTIVMTTTNGTKALRSCAHANTVLAGSFLNLCATTEFIARNKSSHLLLICGGTFDQAAYEDVLCAGAVCNAVWPTLQSGVIADSAEVARRLFLLEQGDLLSAMSRSRNGRRLLARAELCDDVAFCAQLDRVNFAAFLDRQGRIRRVER